jgi:hypothetical protein
MSDSDNWRQIVVRAWNESAFKNRLLAAPNDVLTEYGISIPDGVTFAVVEDQLRGTRFLVLPPVPDPNNPDLSVDDFGRDAESGDPGF